MTRAVPGGDIIFYRDIIEYTTAAACMQPESVL